MNSELHILILEDFEPDAELTERALKKGALAFNARVAKTKSEFLNEIDSFSPDVILADHSLSDFDSVEALELVRSRSLDIPFILVTGTVSEEFAAECLRRGADDYLVKPNLERLPSAVVNAIRRRKAVIDKDKALAALSSSEGEFRALHQLAPIGIVSVDASGKFIRCNPAVERILGYTQNELQALTFAEITYPEDIEIGAQYLRSLVEGTVDTATFEKRYIRKDQSLVLVHLLVSVVRNSKGDFERTITILEDITERRAMERELALREQRLNAFFTGATAGLALFDDQLRFIQINDTLAEMNGIPAAAHVGKSVRELLPDLAPLAEVNMRRVLETGKPIFDLDLSGETPLRPGVRRHWVESFFPIVGRTGKAEGLGAIVVETTERKNAEERLRRSEENYRGLFESALDAIVTLAPNGTISTVNAAFERIGGWNRSEWIGKSYTDILHPDDRLVANEIFRRLISGEHIPPHEYRIRMKSGEFLTAELTSAAQIVEGKVGGVLIIARDTREKKRLEKQLLQAQKMESIGTLAGGIAHDFNNILGIILAYATMLQQKVNDAAVAQKALETIVSSVHRGANIVRQILTFARQANVSLSPVSVNSVIEELARLLRETFPKKIEIALHLDKSVPLIILDQTQLHQALLNLCVNARDAILDPASNRMRAGKLDIRTAVVDGETLRRRLPDAGAAHYVEIVVSDNGSGMDEKTRENIFEPFFTTKEAGKGTGLGLAVVYGVVHSHEGVIEVESDPGRGTSFKLCFPIPEHVVEADVQSESPAVTMVGHETILLVEDEDDLREFVRTVLEDHGYVVLSAADGIEAVTVYSRQRKKIALIVCDLGLPKLDGPGVFATLKEIDPGIRILFASGYIENALRSQLLTAGAAGIIQKPYTADVLLTKIREVIDQYPPQAGGATNDLQ